MFKQNLTLFASSTFAAIAFAGCSQTSPKTVEAADLTTETTATPRPTPTNQEPITITAVGDVMLGSTFPNESRMPPNDGKDLLKGVTPFISSADIGFGNLEGPMLEGGVSEKCGASSSNCFAFRVPVRYGQYLKDAGFDVMSVANNHAGDFGENGRTSTRKILDDLGIKHAGGDRNKFATTMLEVRGKKVVFIGFAHNNISLNVNELDAARGAVKAARKNADILVVSFHGGAEGTDAQNVPYKNEVFFGQSRGNLREFTHTVIDAGADLVLGHGPHVWRGMEIYKDRLIAYSMGNFATYGWFGLKGATSTTGLLQVQIGSDGKFLGGKIIAAEQLGRGGPTLDKANKTVSIVRNLSNTDFGANAVTIKDDGTLSLPTVISSRQRVVSR
ncbi:MAG: CapA family protein [Pyrinomonadaceae bacterium]|nr:CapA family protein [Pyrinomonadaceae bacterium]